MGLRRFCFGGLFYTPIAVIWATKTKKVKKIASAILLRLSPTAAGLHGQSFFRSFDLSEPGCKLLLLVAAQRVSKSKVIFSKAVAVVAEIADCCAATALTVRV